MWRILEDFFDNHCNVVSTQRISKIIDNSNIA